MFTHHGHKILTLPSLLSALRAPRILVARSHVPSCTVLSDGCVPRSALHTPERVRLREGASGAGAERVRLRTGPWAEEGPASEEEQEDPAQEGATSWSEAESRVITCPCGSRGR